MFNIGPLELLVLAIVGLIVLGPDRLPDLARDAARLLRNLRDVATGARKQLRDELGPEFSDIDLRNLNPRTAVQRAVFGEEVDLRKYHPRTAIQDMLLGDDTAGDETSGEPEKPVSMRKPSPRPSPGPRPSPHARVFDEDAT